MIEPYQYEIILDKIFTNGKIWKHRTFRTIFDPYSAEWHSTSMQEKVDILKEIEESGADLNFIISDYKKRYNDANRYDIAECVEDALAEIKEYSLNKDA